MLTLSFFNGSWFKLLPGTPSWSLINLLDHSRTQRNIWLLRLLMCHNQMEAIHWTRYRDRAWGFSATWLSMLPEWLSVHQPRSSLNPFVLCSYGDYFTQTRTHTVVNNPLAAAGDSRDKGLIPALGRSPGVGNGNLLQYSCLENSIDRGRLESTGSQVHGDWACMHTHTHTHTHTHKRMVKSLVTGIWTQLPTSLPSPQVREYLPTFQPHGWFHWQPPATPKVFLKATSLA